ncbi:YncE family protein [Geomesophilobacter sediminis]|uniref:Uncharacterized protein n=1 Tax=Geomesophilobacter sediminis TaxID=2798584 RepID=A0A8J7LYN4_9BACT|nr:hypothetical protein [Geomesophilobacter sediminis]MBJ6725152.1 hypothetical protein [Geomesophilobacter sediminis]
MMSRWKGAVLAALTALALGITGCGTSGSSSGTAANAVVIGGALEPGAARATLKTVGAAASNQIGTVVALDAATGAIISTAPVAVVADSTGSGGTFSGLTINPQATPSGVVLKVTLNDGKTYRSLLSNDLSSPGTLSATVGPKSDAIVVAVSTSLGLNGVLGDLGVKVPAGTKLADVVAKVNTASAAVLPLLEQGYVINTGGSGQTTPGFSIINRTTQSVVKTVRFSNLTGLRVGHFANVTADGSELWLCSNKRGGAAGDMNVYNLAGFANYSTVNAGNQASLIKHSFQGVGCGVQNVQSPNGRYLFASSDQGTKGINVFDVANHRYLGNITNNNTAPHVGAVSQDGTKYYTSTSSLYHVVGYDISGLPNAVPTDANKTFDLSLGYGGIHAIRLHPGGRYLFVGNNTWPVPSSWTGAVTSGTNVVDLQTQRIIATIPGRPHNYAISPDGKYLLVTELSSPDCEVSLPGDPGNRLQFIDISTLLTASPDPTKILDIKHFDTPGYGGSHAAWDPTTGILYYSVYDTANQGWLIKLNTSGLSAATPSVAQIGDKIKIGAAPHGVLFPGINSD